jgi:hypothetical protein
VQTELEGVLHALEEKLAEKRNTVPNSGPPFCGSFVWWVLPFCVLLQTPLFYFPLFEPEIFRVSLNIHNIFSTVFGEHFRESTPGALQSMFLDEERMKSCGFDSFGWRRMKILWIWLSKMALGLTFLHWMNAKVLRKCHCTIYHLLLIGYIGTSIGRNCSLLVVVSYILKSQFWWLWVGLANKEKNHIRCARNIFGGLNTVYGWSCFK